MDLDILTEHVAMRQAWHRTIDEWVERCARRHPGLLGLELTLRHDERHHPGEEVEVVATGRGRRLRASARAGLMDEALYGALGALEQDLVVDEALHHPT